MEALEAGHEHTQDTLNGIETSPPPPFFKMIGDLFLDIKTFFLNFIGVDEKVDKKAIVEEKWTQDDFLSLRPRIKMAPDGDFLTPKRSEPQKYFLDLETRDGIVVVQVSKHLYDKTSRGKTIGVVYQVGRFDSAKLNGIRVFLP